MIAKNNPFNIRVGSRWIGLSGSHCGFCEFQTLETGVRAACILLMQSYRKKGIIRIFDIIMRFAPLSENNSVAYIDYICKCTGYSRYAVLTTSWQYAKILSSMAWYESHTAISVSYLYHIFDKFKISVYEKGVNY